MRRLLLLLLICAAALHGAAAQARVIIEPPTGGPHRTFVVRADTKRIAAWRQPEYDATVFPRRRSCGSASRPVLQASRVGKRVVFRFKAPRHGWCVSRYTVLVELTQLDFDDYGADDSCDEPESGSSQCDDDDLMTETERLGQARFRVR